MRIAALLMLLAVPAAASAELVELKWTGAAFAHKAAIAPKKFLEICGKLKKGESIAWQFKGSGPGDFNIHYHVGNDVTYPEKRKEIASADGTFVAPLDQDYCWMWSNRAAQPIDIEVNLKQVKAAN